MPLSLTEVAEVETLLTVVDKHWQSYLDLLDTEISREEKLKSVHRTVLSKCQRIHRGGRTARSPSRQSFSVRKAAKSSDDGGGGGPDGRPRHYRNFKFSCITRKVPTCLAGGAN